MSVDLNHNKGGKTVSKGPSSQSRQRPNHTIRSIRVMTALDGFLARGVEDNYFTARERYPTGAASDRRYRRF